MQRPNDELIKIEIGNIFNTLVFKKSQGTVKLVKEDYETIKIQLKAYGLIEIKYLQTTNKTMAWFWNLTAKGEQEMMNSRVIRKK
jgi:hypothetical protein